MDATGGPADNRKVQMDRLVFGAIAVLGGIATLGATAIAVVVEAPAEALWWALAGVAPLYAAGLFAYWRRPSHPSVRCLLLAGSLLAASTVFEYWLRLAQPGAAPTLWLVGAGYVVTDIGASLTGVGFFALFPVGRPERRYERMIVRVAVAIAVTLPVLLMTSRATLTVNPFSIPGFPAIANPTFLPVLAPIGGVASSGTSASGWRPCPPRPSCSASGIDGLGSPSAGRSAGCSSGQPSECSARCPGYSG